MRKIVIMIGSDSDLAQCITGLFYLFHLVETGAVEVVAIITNSIHRNTMEVLNELAELHERGDIDCIVVGAGMANHLTGTCDAYLRYTLKNDKVVILGVAFEGKTADDTLAAILSIEKVPGTQVMFDRNKHVGEEGFFNACKLAVEGELRKIELKPGKHTVRRTLKEAVDAAEKSATKGAS